MFYSGILQDFNPSLLGGGWSLCYRTTYDTALTSTVVDSILNVCSGSKLLLGCRQVNAVNLKLAAMGNRADVLYDCGSTVTCSYVSNGVAWYFSKTYSWGFARPGDPINRQQCDYNAGADETKRLCWHTDLGNAGGGYRCGEVVGLNSDSSWERIIYHSP